jgi:hypothetical protein
LKNLSGVKRLRDGISDALQESAVTAQAQKAV